NTGVHGTTHQFHAKAVDAAGNESPASFTHTVTIDTQAPTRGAITRLDIKQPSGLDTFTVEVAYVDNGSGIDPLTIGTGDIVLDAPFLIVPMMPSFVSFDPLTGVATYTFPAPAGGWDSNYAGQYFVAIRSN